MTNNEKLKRKIQEANPEIEKREELYRCNRVWEAWQVGTMREEDFEEVNLSEILTIEDCLITMRKKVYDNSGNYRNPRQEEDLILMWELGKDLDWHIKNKPKTIKFLKEILLCHTK